MIANFGKWLAGALLWVVVALCLVITFVPAFLDHIYYEGPESAHYDGAYFSNPDGEISFPVQPGHRRGNLLTRFLLSRSDRPDWPDHVAVMRSRPPARVSGTAMRATWVGHASVLVQAGGINILTDPIWSEYASPFPGIGPSRVAEPGVRFADLPKIDLVVVSHDHYDHMDLPTLKRLWDRDRPVIVTSLGNDTILRGAGVPARALDWGDTLDVAGARVHVLRNHHWSSRWGKDKNRALWSSFLVETAAGNVFFAGDTGIGDGKWVDAARALGPIRLAMLPIGAFRFYPGQMNSDAHIGPGQAVEVFGRLGASAAIPIHWGTFRLSNEGYDTPPRMLHLFMDCAGLAQERFAPLKIGGVLDVPAYSAAVRGRADMRPCTPGSAALAALK